MTKLFFAKFLSASLIVMLALGAMPVTPARAATLTVTTNAGGAVAADGACSLREAIINANNDAATNADCAAGTGDDIIQFSAAVTTITIAGAALPAINDAAGGNDLTIDGGGDVTIDGGGAFRIFNITAGTFTIQNITLSNGQVNGNGGAILYAGGEGLSVSSTAFNTNRTITGGGNDGGAIYHTAGALSILNSSFTSNYTQDNGGAIYIASGAGTMTINGSTFTSNNNGAIDDGGAIYLAGGTLSIGNASANTFSGNAASGNGGAIYVNGGTLTINNTSFTNATAANSADSGGAIYHNAATLLTVTNSTFTGNTATAGDGGAIATNNNGSSLTIDGSAFTNNTSTDDGGAIANVGEPTRISNSAFTGNSITSSTGNAALGGAIRNEGAADDTRITLSTFINNSVTHSGNENAQGGGIANEGSGFVLANSAFSGNSVTKNGAGANNAQGGGVWANAGSTIHNVTFSGNTATESGTGTADGGNLYRNGGTVTVRNTILVDGLENGAAGNCGGTLGAAALNASFADNLSTTDCGAAVTTGSPNLGALTGSPPYFPLNSGSSAIGTGDPTICQNAASTNDTSQNGVDRITAGTDTTCDIGSYETPAARLTLLKDVVNDNGGTAVDTAWTLSATGPTNISGAEGDAAITNAIVAPGNYTLSESGGPAGYTQTGLACSGAADANPADGLSIIAGENVTCTFTNNDTAPTLTLLKDVINDNGGTAADTAWTLSATGPTNISGVEGDSAITNATVLAGNYMLTESSGPAAYTLTGIACSGSDANGADGLTLLLGETVTCTFTNNDNAPSLTLLKDVINDNGGTAADIAWTLSASGPTNINGVEGDSSITNAAITPGNYTLNESGGPAGYNQTGLTCSGAADTNPADGLTVAFGETVTCTFTNNDIAPTLTLVKNLTNDDGGTNGIGDWTLSATGPSTISGVTGAGSVTNASVDAGSYTLSETVITGYTQTAITCTGNDANGADGLDLDPGENVTCTFFNDDIGATLTLLKDVTNDNIGAAVDSDWTLTATGPTTISGVEGAPAVTGAGVNAGNYTLTESGPANYTQTAITCTGSDPDGSDGLTLTLGEVVACTFFNDDDIPVLLVPNINSNPDTGDATIAENEMILNTVGITQITVEFNWDADNPAGTSGTDDVDNPNNYILLYSATGSFNTPSCAVVAAGGVVAPDIRIPITSVNYSNSGGSFIATLNLSAALTNAGYYRLFVCGTTSIVLAADPTIALSGNGAAAGTDFIRNFQIIPSSTAGGGSADDDEPNLTVAALPATGFAPNRVTILPEQPAELTYSELGNVWMEIPALDIKTSIVGVPQTADGEWDVTWLADNVGWLNGTAFPTWEGNSVLTAHVTKSNGLNGPFANLKKLKYGDQIIIHVSGEKYIFEVRNSRLSRPYATSFAFEDLEEHSYLTLITCQYYLPKSDTYFYRRVVRAVLVSVENE